MHMSMLKELNKHRSYDYGTQHFYFLHIIC